ncbi:inositol phosphorylceramide synthase [Paenibacillus sp. CAA11]|uniref:phosphatase PAP2 family protein n=1 Tax=Paenibacillus sp. CAA11 TaxID=1532905 RepID=UPI000D369D84|nr:phosphatase PAP2 family protein [Paenibacillus sp. CAA11]AWB45700.1 inositol phosphorylceramide synthase [Paenibacillus sp. CAA11]
MLYDSMYLVSLLTLLVTILLIWYGTGRNPFSAAYIFLHRLVTSRRFLLLFAIMAGVLVANKYELQLEKIIDSKADFTPLFFHIEGHFVQNFQQLFHHQWVTEVTAFFYVVVFQSLLIASIGVYAGSRNYVYMYATCMTVILNYAVAIPFYLFFPVNEVWSYAPSGVTFYMLEAFPKFEEIYRPLSGLDNCFPSLHTAISASMAILAVRSGNRRWAITISICAAMIIFAIFYMGIHWLIDMLGGLLLAMVATTLAIKWAERLVDKQQSQLPVTLNY